MIKVNILDNVVIPILMATGVALVGTVVYAEAAYEAEPTPIVITINESISVSDQPPDPNANQPIPEPISVNDDVQVSGTPISEVITVTVVVTPTVESLPTPIPTPTAVAVEKKLPPADEEFCSGRLNRDQKTACLAAVESLEKCTGRLSKEDRMVCDASKEIVESCTDVVTRQDSDVCTQAMKSADSSEATSKTRSKGDVFSRSAGSATETDEDSAAGNGSIWGIVYAIVAVILLALGGMTVYRRKRSN